MNINLLQVPIANAELQLLQKFTKRKNIYNGEQTSLVLSEIVLQDFEMHEFELNTCSP